MYFFGFFEGIKCLKILWKVHLLCEKDLLLRGTNRKRKKLFQDINLKWDYKTENNDNIQNAFCLIFLVKGTEMKFYNFFDETNFFSFSIIPIIILWSILWNCAFHFFWFFNFNFFLVLSGKVSVLWLLFCLLEKVFFFRFLL